MERPLPASDALFDEAADQISGRNLPVFKTGSVYCVSGVPHETIVFFFLFFSLLLLSLNLIYSWATFYLFYFMSFMSNIIREIMR